MLVVCTKSEYDVSIHIHFVFCNFVMRRINIIPLGIWLIVFEFSPVFGRECSSDVCRCWCDGSPFARKISRLHTTQGTAVPISRRSG